MADVVQYKLERMLDELDDLERRGLFSRLEIAEIVKRRRKFEFRLKRPSPLKQDFLAYIEYEKHLDTLRRLRKTSFTNKSGVKKSENSVSDHAGVRRIIETYRIATNRFKGDIELWFQYLEFCRARGHGRMKKALGQLVKFHPKVPGVWMYAAAWEFDTNLNVAAARALMQNGLRACPDSEDLWVEYLRMELTYLNKLKARKVELGEDKGTLIRKVKNADEEDWRDVNKESFVPLDEKETDEVEGKVDMLQEHGMNILQTVYSGAIEALPTSFSLRTKFLEIMEAMVLAHSEDMRIKILDDLKRDFSKEPLYWDWLARAGINGSKRIKAEQLTKAIQAYEEGLEVVPSATMFNLYVKFLMELINFESKGDESIVAPISDDHDVDVVSHLQIVFEKAESLGCITEDIARQHVSFILQMGKLDEATKLLEKLCSGKFTNSVHLWTSLISLKIKSTQNKPFPPSKADLVSIFELLRNILMKVGISESDNLWLMGLKFFSNQRYYFDKLVETSLYVLTKDGGSDGSFSISSTVITYILQRDGVESAREMYKRYIALPHPGLAIYKSCIELELNLASTGDKTGLPNARKLYDSALTTYNQDRSLWRDYHSMEVKMGTSESAAAVHWRARKALKSDVPFLP